MELHGTAPLEAERIILRRFVPDDAPAVFYGWAGRFVDAWLYATLSAEFSG